MRENREKGILFPFALDEHGATVAAETAPAGRSYYCLGCGQQMVVRRGTKNQPHFAHKVETNTCSAETALHLLAKETIKRGVEGALRDDRPYEFEWHCPICWDDNRGNLAITPRRLLVEAHLGDIRPDLLAVNESGDPLVAIEVVVTHAPEEKAIDVYKRIELPVVVIEEVEWDDLTSMEESLLHMDVRVLNGPCRSSEHPPDCPGCLYPMRPIELEVWEGYTCRRCHRPMPVLFFPKFLRDEERVLLALEREARKLRVPFSIYKTKRGERNAAHRCPRCRAWQRNLYVYNGRYDNWEPRPKKPVKTVRLFWCEQCKSITTS